MAKTLRILSIGLGKHLPDPELAARVMKMVEDDTAKAAQSGFEIIALYANLKDVQGSIDDIKTTLKTKGPWDGLNIGFGVRGVKEHTALFEEIVNVSRETLPNTRLLFSPAPDQLFETCVRNFPNQSKGT